MSVTENNDEELLRVSRVGRISLSPMLQLTSILHPHKLHNSWVVWYTNKALKTDNYEEKIMPLGEFSSCEEFWSLYSHLLRPNRIPVATDYHLFKKGIKPMWEDSNNRGGGKWMLRLKKEHTNRLWESMLLAIIGEQLAEDLGESEICGGVVSVRHQEDILALWNRTAGNHDIKDVLGDRIKQVLELPHNVVMEYKEHDKSMAFLQDSKKLQQAAAEQAAAEHAAAESADIGGLAEERQPPPVGKLPPPLGSSPLAGVGDFASRSAILPGS
eukprot:GEMP01023872.1.p1 GENE.GEMP01023872.1~~GEMP01023872.1.p1  ORF type:complete len:271 (+),score=39.17 GEMP01023872.1:16-828(+)